MKIQRRSISVEEFESGVLVTFGEAPFQPRCAVVLHAEDAKATGNLIATLIKYPEPKEQCNGTVVHDNYTLCPVHDRT